MAQIPQMRYLYLTSAFLRKKEETPLLYSFVNKYFELLVLLTHAVLKTSPSPSIIQLQRTSTIRSMQIAISINPVYWAAVEKSFVYFPERE